jgi:alginate O-acetyltransferase complex protein AlgI
MLFNSLEFIIYFPIVVAFYFAISPRYRWILLLIASYYFYMCWNYKYIILIITSTIIDYIAGIHISREKVRWRRKSYLLLSLLTNLGLLFSFKYFNFFGDSLNFIFDKINVMQHLPELNVLLPVGISFYTFQTLSYTIDVYKGVKEPERHFGKFALYVAFFPQLVAGPIERSTRLMPQMHMHFKFDYERVKNGILQMCWGFFKKVVIADRLAEYVNLVYNNAGDYGGTHYIIATVFFAFQIYCDFSGYSDIAIGSASIMGYNLMRNFKRPYLAPNIREFWQRWHISLSTWFRDYLYIPLGGNRVVKWRWYYNLFITFLISGLWHGANWTFVIWGALHGFYLVFAIWTANIRKKINGFIFGDKVALHNIVQVLITVLLAWFAWIFFRANDIGDAFLIIKNIFTASTGPLNLFTFKADFFIAVVLIVILVVIEILEERIQLYEKLQKFGKPLKWLLLVLIILAIVILGKWESVDFLYFQF